MLYIYTYICIKTPIWSSTIIVTLHNMERFVTDYSAKNIPIPSKQYEIELISKKEKVIKRMRWKCLEFLRKIKLKVENRSWKLWFWISQMSTSGSRSDRFWKRFTANDKRRRVQTEYINSCSNQPPTVIKQLPKSIRDAYRDALNKSLIF